MQRGVLAAVARPVGAHLGARSGSDRKCLSARSGLPQLQRRRIEEAGLRLRTLATLTDVDTYEAAMEVAEADPLTRFAATFRYLDSRVALQG